MSRSELNPWKRRAKEGCLLRLSSRGDAGRQKRRKPGPAMKLSPAFVMSGDAGIRTRVRLPIPRSVYVRIQPFCSPRSLIGRLKAPCEPAVKISPAPSRRQTQASQNLSTPGGPPQAGLTDGWEVRSPVRGVYLRSQGEVIVRRYNFPGDLTSAPSSSARSHGFTVRVETCHPHDPVFSINAPNLTPVGERVNLSIWQRLTGIVLSPES